MGSPRRLPTRCPEPFAKPIFTADWDYMPQPGYRIDRLCEAHPSLATSSPWFDLGAALLAFRRLHLPPVIGSSATIKDRAGVVVFGWSLSEQLMADMGAPGWWGVREAFRIAETLPGFDMMDLAVWEATAMRTTSP